MDLPLDRNGVRSEPWEAISLLAGGRYVVVSRSFTVPLVCRECRARYRYIWSIHEEQILRYHSQMKPPTYQNAISLLMFPVGPNVDRTWVYTWRIIYGNNSIQEHQGPICSRYIEPAGIVVPGKRLRDLIYIIVALTNAGKIEETLGHFPKNSSFEMNKSRTRFAQSLSEGVPIFS